MRPSPEDVLQEGGAGDWPFNAPSPSYGIRYCDAGLHYLVRIKEKYGDWDQASIDAILDERLICMRAINRSSPTRKEDELTFWPPGRYLTETD